VSTPNDNNGIMPTIARDVTAVTMMTIVTTTITITRIGIEVSTGKLRRII